MSTDSHPPETPFLDRAHEAALTRLTQAGDDALTLSRVDQTILAVSSAQGVIDNGGFQDFFESDWPNTPPYSFFSDAYRRIGAQGPAACIDEAAALFPFDNPEQHDEERREFLGSLPETHALFELGDRVRGDTSVWGLLERYAKEHSGH